MNDAERNAIRARNIRINRRPRNGRHRAGRGGESRNARATRKRHKQIFDGYMRVAGLVVEYWRQHLHKPSWADQILPARKIA